MSRRAVVIGHGMVGSCAGSRAWLPPIDGITADEGRLADGVAAFRDLDVADSDPPMLQAVGEGAA